MFDGTITPFAGIMVELAITIVLAKFAPDKDEATVDGFKGTVFAAWICGCLLFPDVSEPCVEAE